MCDICELEKKEVNRATKSSGLHKEVVSALREGYAPQTVWQAIGRSFGISEATFLLSAMCEHSRELGEFFICEKTGSTQERKSELRTLWNSSQQYARSSQGWELPEQCQVQLTELVSKLPQKVPFLNALNQFTGSPLANGVPHRVGKLRGYGNAIVPQVAAEVIRSYMEWTTGIPAEFWVD